MAPILFKVTKTEGTSFHIQVNEMPYQYNRLHFHPEYQISLVLKGKGLVSIGYSLDTFEPDTIYVIAPNVPHVFKNEAAYFKASNKTDTHMVSIFFRPDSFGTSFLNLPELAKIKDFLRTAARGIKLKPALVTKIKEIILQLIEAKGAMRFILLIQMLNGMALSEEKVFLSNVPYNKKANASDGTMNKIFNYISRNFDRPISLEEVSKIAHLDKYAFCRYFKKVTHKSFITYLNEFRVSMACKFLIKNTYNISQIGFLVGYNNISNFYKQFKKIMKVTPSKYRELYGQL